jgi:hypothetical protein
MIIFKGSERKRPWPNYKVLSYHLSGGTERNNETVWISSPRSHIWTRSLPNTEQECWETLPSNLGTQAGCLDLDSARFPGQQTSQNRPRLFRSTSTQHWTPHEPRTCNNEDPTESTCRYATLLWKGCLSDFFTEFLYAVFFTSLMCVLHAQTIRTSPTKNINWKFSEIPVAFSTHAFCLLFRQKSPKLPRFVTEITNI